MPTDVTSAWNDCPRIAPFRDAETGKAVLFPRCTQRRRKPGGKFEYRDVPGEIDPALLMPHAGDGPEKSTFEFLRFLAILAATWVAAGIAIAIARPELLQRILGQLGF